jgi:hypothetical protein
LDFVVAEDSGRCSVAPPQFVSFPVPVGHSVIRKYRDLNREGKLEHATDDLPFKGFLLKVVLDEEDVVDEDDVQMT